MKTIKTTATTISILLFLTLLPCISGAQKKSNAAEKDTLGLYREFIEACALYKQLPLQLELELRNTTNFITGEEDTAGYKAAFYIGDKNAYIRFGEVEQFVTDSMALLVSSRLQRMILFSDAQAVAFRLRALTGPAVKDSNAFELAKKYTVHSFQETNSTRLQLTGRNLLPSVNLPKESIELQYSKEEKTLLQVTTIRRTLIPVDQPEYELLKARPEVADHLLQIPEKGYYLLKEQKGVFLYKSVRHQQGFIPPASVEDRIRKNNQGEYMGVKGYEGYAITLN